MIEVCVNGQQKELAAGASVQDLLDELGAPAGGRGVAVALDGEVVPRGAWTTTLLAPDARLEVLVAVQGG